MTVLSESFPRTRFAIRNFLEDVLDDMPVTERPYHHLNHSMPLVESILAKVVARASAGDPVLMIGGSALLGSALIRLGYDLDLWQFPNAANSLEMEERISREITPAEVGDVSISPGEYRLIILPLVIESIPAPIEQLLRHLREGLSPDGGIVLATRNPSRLGVRATAIAGRRTQNVSRRVSLSWPALPVEREYHRDDLIEGCRKAGFRVSSCEFLTGTRMFMELDNLAAGPYAARQAGALFQRAIPSTRDTIVMEISTRVPDRIGWQNPGSPTVSVIVSAAHGGEQFRAALASLSTQTYPGQYEIIVVHRGDRPDISKAIQDLPETWDSPVREIVVDEPEGPVARNAATAAATGDICAHTDDACEPPPDWVEGAVRHFDDDTALVAGPIIAMPGGYSRFLELPGLRPEPAEGEAWRDDLFPISNAFYRTAVVLASGGFSTSFIRADGSPATGWDTDLAWQLQRSGWKAQFREEVCMFRRFPGPQKFWFLDQAEKAADMPAFYRSVPEIAGTSPKAGPFASPHTMYFDLMMLGASVAVARRKWYWLLLSLPWLTANSKRMDFWPPASWKHTGRVMGKLGVLHLAWLSGLMYGSIKARRPVL